MSKVDDLDPIDWKEETREKVAEWYAWTAGRWVPGPGPGPCREGHHFEYVGGAQAVLQPASLYCRRCGEIRPYVVPTFLTSGVPDGRTRGLGTESKLIPATETAAPNHWDHYGPIPTPP